MEFWEACVLEMDLLRSMRFFMCFSIFIGGIGSSSKLKKTWFDFE